LYREGLGGRLRELGRHRDSGLPPQARRSRASALLAAAWPMPSLRAAAVTLPVSCSAAASRSRFRSSASSSGVTVRLQSLTVSMWNITAVMSPQSVRAGTLRCLLTRHRP
jgi:hypothetical protein